jgi:hypothetical protein
VVVAAIAVAVKVSGLPLRPVAVAVRLLIPTPEPRVQLFTVATPFEPVEMGVVGSTLPPPELTANVTLTPDTGFPLASETITAGSIGTAVPAAAV